MGAMTDKSIQTDYGQWCRPPGCGIPFKDGVKQCRCFDSFREAFEHFRIGREVTYRQITQRCGLSISYWCDIQAGRKRPPSPEYVIPLDDLLDANGVLVELAEKERAKPTYEELEAEVERRWAALEEAVRLQSHYAQLLNMWDGGERMVFENADAWIARLKDLKGHEAKDSEM